MRALKIVTIAMAVLIVLGTTVLLVALVRRAPAPGLPAEIAATLKEPPGTRIVGIAAVQDRLAVHLQGGGADRVLLVDPRSGAVAGRISLAP